MDLKSEDSGQRVVSVGQGSEYHQLVVKDDLSEELSLLEEREDDVLEEVHAGVHVLNIV